MWKYKLVFYSHISNSISHILVTRTTGLIGENSALGTIVAYKSKKVNKGQ